MPLEWSENRCSFFNVLEIDIEKSGEKFLHFYRNSMPFGMKDEVKFPMEERHFVYAVNDVAAFRLFGAHLVYMLLVYAKTIYL